jgi:Cu/Ag efflux pump CusA
MAAPLNELVPVLQVAISPVILISGVGLLLLSLSNRFGRAVDRSRQLAREMRQLPPADRQRLSEQVRILYRRAALIQLAITMAAISVLLAAVLIISLFLIALMGWKSGVLPLSALFIGCMLSLIVSLLAFLREIHWSLTALKLELEPPAEG